MAQFASKTPRDLNHDPEPWVYEIAGNGFRSHIPFTSPGDLRVMDWAWSPRPEFDHVPRPGANEPNPILVAFRIEVRLQAETDWMSMQAVAQTTLDRQDGFEDATNAQCDHARRVLERLAAQEALEA